MTMMRWDWWWLFAAAVLEVGGDWLIRHARTGHAGLPPMLLGAFFLVAYGFVVTSGDWATSFGQLMGVYIAMFFVVSQLFSWLVDGVYPTAGIWIGAPLIVLGGMVIEFWPTK